MTALGIGVAMIAGVLVSATFYAVVPVPAASTAPEESPAVVWQVLVEIVRSAVTAGLVTGLLVTGGWSGPATGSLLGLALTVLPLVLLTGSVVHERVPLRAAAGHAGDWAIKLTVIGAVTGSFT